MASSAAAAAVSSGAGASGAAANGPSLAAGNKSHFKSNATAPSAAKAMDGGRRQSGSPVDGPQRRPSQKAWTQGTNPITQRNINNSLPNGTPHQARNAAKGSLVPHHDLLSADRHADDRLLYLLANCVGRKATIEAKTGEVYAGIFSCSLSETTDAFWLLKMVKRKAAGSDRRPGGTDGASSGYIGSGPEHSMYFDIKDVVELAVDGVEFGDRSTKGPNGMAHANSFRTDNDISGNQTGRERTLQRWEPSAEDDPGLALEDGNDGRGGLAGSNGTWDQFEANKRLYGITSDYDVNLYTTAIDRSDPQYKNNLARAEKIAREIEASSAMNAHVAEERGLAPAVDDSGMDEEAKYSEVRRTSKAADQPVPMSSQDGTPNRYTPPARRAPAAASSMTPALLKDPAIVSQKARQDPALPHPAETKGRNGLAQVKPMPAARDERNLAPSAGANNMRPRALPAGSRAAPAAAATAKQPASLQGPVANNLTSPRTKAPGESATTTVEHDVRDAFKQFANTEKMRLQEHRRNQAKHDKDIKLNDLMKFSQNFKLTTPVPKDLVPILAKDKTKQEEIVQRAQRNVESSRVIPGSGKKPIATGADAKVQVKPSAADTAAATAAATKKVAAATTTTTTTTTTTSAGAPMTRPEGGARQAQLTMPDRQPPGRGRPGQSGHGGVGGHQGRPPPAPPNAGMPPGRAGPGLSQRLTNFQQMNRGSAAQMHVPPPLPIHDHRGPPAGPVGGGVPEPHRYGGAPTPTSATSSRFNVSAIEFKPAGIAFAPTAEPSAASSPRSNVNAGTPSRAATPSGFFGAKRPLPASERRPILEHFNPLRRLRQEAEQNKEEWPSNGGIKPAHKTGPRWEVADTNREKTYAEMFEKVPFSTQSVSPQHPSYAAPHLPHQHQLPFHLQHGGPVVPQPPTAHQVPHHLHSQQQQHHQHHQHQQQQQQHHHHHHHHHHQQQQHQHQQHPHHHHHPHPHPHHPHPPVGVPHHFDDHRMHVSSSPSVLPSPRLQPVHMAYQSPMGPHAQIVYGQPMPQYAMAPAGPPMAPLRQYPSGSHFVHQHGAHVAPMMTHSPSGGHMAAGIPQGVGAPYGQPMPVYSPNPVQAYMHPGGPPPPQPGSSGYPSPGRAAPMMIHQGSQPGQPPHQMMMFGMSPGQQSQHLYVSHPPVQGPGPRGGNYPPPQQPHYTAMPPAHHVSAHHRGGPTYGHQPPPPPHVAHVATQPAASGPGHGGGHDDEDLK